MTPTPRAQLLAAEIMAMGPMPAVTSPAMTGAEVASVDPRLGGAEPQVTGRDGGRGMADPATVSDEDTAGANRARPVLKWAGGKTRLLPDLLARMPSSYRRYYEPFVGGGALFFRVAPERVVLGDANADLIACYRAIGRFVHVVAQRLREHSAAHSEGHFNAIKLAWNRRMYRPDDTEHAAAFIYLNKACFNGLYRVNHKGEFNVGFGKRVTYEPDLENLRAAALELQRATLRAGDYRETLFDVEAGDFVYLDPTYDPASKTANFDGYTPEGSDHVDQAEIAYAVRKLVERGVQVMVSNANTKRVRDLYAGMRIDVVHAPRNVNSDAKGRGLVEEVIVTAGYTPCAAAIAQVAAERAAAKKNKRAKSRRKARRAS